MAAAVDQQILIAAYVRYGERQGVPALEAVWAAALANTQKGVSVTSVTFEGASGSGVANEFDSAKLLVVVQQALDILEGNTANSRVTHASFAGAFLQT